ncbi:MAG: methyltransferase domain-containing protein [Candidatus Eisenbacteria bacterium]|nr:methyltransferase domain-containing protein [Candidatus Eisenbacteria bacterium]
MGRSSDNKDAGAMIEQALAPIDVQGLTVLEAGTGAGRMTRYLAEHGARWVASVSNEWEHLEYARNRTPEELQSRIGYLLADLRSLAMMPSETFDLATAHFLLSVTGPIDGLKILHELFRVLREGGRLVIIEYAPFYPSTSSTSWIQQEYWRLENALGVLLTGKPSYTEYPSDWLADHLECLGFADVECVRIAENIRWPSELLLEHAEEIREDLAKLRHELLRRAFREQLERLVEAGRDVDVRSGAVYALYATKS